MVVRHKPAPGARFFLDGLPAARQVESTDRGDSLPISEGNNDSCENIKQRQGHYLGYD